jgi:BirA family biotin operon repressor/biotin-[acetyl-CoA-carboxylase] ligase
VPFLLVSEIKDIARMVEALRADPESIYQRGELQHFPSLGSTNARMVDAAGKGAPEGSVIIADEQTAGRGRGVHQWHSPRNTGIYVSVLLRPRTPASEIVILSLLAGLAAHAALRDISAINADLRWPNDVLLNGRKLGGILIEAATEGERVRHAVVGIGLNINQSAFPPELQAVATSLRIESGKDWPILEITTALLKSLDKEYRALLRSEHAHASVLDRFTQCSSYVRGARVQVQDHNGAEYSGTTAGLDENGFLRVQTSTGLRKVVSGGVRKI